MPPSNGVGHLRFQACSAQQLGSPVVEEHWQSHAAEVQKSTISELIMEHVQLAELSYLQGLENRVNGRF